MPRIRSTAHEEREEEETGARALQLPLVGSPLFCSLVCFLVPPSPCPLRRPERLSLSSAAPLEKQTGRVFVALFCPPLSSPSSSSSFLLLKTLSCLPVRPSNRAQNIHEGERRVSANSGESSLGEKKQKKNGERTARLRSSLLFLFWIRTLTRLVPCSLDCSVLCERRVYTCSPRLSQLRPVVRREEEGFAFQEREPPHLFLHIFHSVCFVSHLGSRIFGTSSKFVKVQKDLPSQLLISTIRQIESCLGT